MALGRRPAVGESSGPNLDDDDALERPRSFRRPKPRRVVCSAPAPAWAVLAGPGDPRALHLQIGTFSGSNCVRMASRFFVPDYIRDYKP